MKAIFLTRFGTAGQAFELRETAIPVPGPRQVLIKVQGFGLNFADVMARKGLYQDCPPRPAILGYDVCGIVEAVGEGVAKVAPGDRVAAMTRFGGYAEYALSDVRACMKIGPELNTAEATALATQYCTAYFCAAEMVNLHEGDKVLIHAGAGGVGTALIQYCRYKGCEIFATAGSEAKVALLRQYGVQHPIQYTKQAFDKVIREKTQGKGVDVIFDSVGARYFRKGIRSLASGGRMVGFGAADMSGSRNIFSQIKGALGFGFYHPAQFLMSARSLIGVNMLRIADDKPEMMERCFTAVGALYREGVFRPVTGKIFPYTRIADAHAFLESRQSVGKIAIEF